eukprot:4873492-Amphidinium_carterae.1
MSSAHTQHTTYKLSTAPLNKEQFVEGRFAQRRAVLSTGLQRIVLFLAMFLRGVVPLHWIAFLRNCKNGTIFSSSISSYNSNDRPVYNGT